MGVDVELLTDVQRLRPDRSEVDRLLCDNTAAAQRFAWSPSYGGMDGFRRGLTETVAWFAEPGNLHQYKADRFNE